MCDGGALEKNHCKMVGIIMLRAPEFIDENVYYPSTPDLHTYKNGRSLLRGKAVPKILMFIHLHPVTLSDSFVLSTGLESGACLDSQKCSPFFFLACFDIRIGF